MLQIPDRSWNSALLPAQRGSYASPFVSCMIRKACRSRLRISLLIFRTLSRLEQDQEQTQEWSKVGWRRIWINDDLRSRSGRISLGHGALRTEPRVQGRSGVTAPERPVLSGHCTGANERIPPQQPPAAGLADPEAGHHAGGRRGGAAGTGAVGVSREDTGAGTPRPHLFRPAEKTWRKAT